MKKVVLLLGMLLIVAGVVCFVVLNDMNKLPEAGNQAGNSGAAADSNSGGNSLKKMGHKGEPASLSSMAGAMPKVTRVDPDQDVFELMGIREVTEAEQKAYQEEMRQIREANKNDDSELEIKIKKVAPGEYKMTDDGLAPVDKDSKNPGVIMVVPEEKTNDEQ